MPRVNAFGDAISMVSRDYDDIALAVRAANDTHVSAFLTSRQYDDCTDTRLVDALAIFEKRSSRPRIRGGVAGSAEDEIDEVGTP